MGKIVTLICDVCGRTNDETEIIPLGNDKAICEDDQEARRRRASGRPVFQPTEPHYHYREDHVTYGGPYPRMGEKQWSCEYQTPTLVSFLDDELTPEQAVALIVAVDSLSHERLVAGLPEIPPLFDVEVRVTWNDLDLGIVDEAIDQFLAPALGLLDDEGRRLPVPQTLATTTET